MFHEIILLVKIFPLELFHIDSQYAEFEFILLLVKVFVFELSKATHITFAVPVLFIKKLL